MRNVVLFTLVLGVFAQLQAQPEPVGALEALKLVPAEFLQLDNGGLVTYTNWPASYAGLGLDMPSAWSEPGVGDNLPNLLAALPPGAPAAVVQYALMAGNYPESIGIDLFRIAETVEFGQPPAQVLGLLGDFELQAIEAAFLSREYMVAAEGDYGLALCPLAGCDRGNAFDLSGRDPSNPFGGDMGRRQPVLASANYLISSPSDSSMAAVTEAVSGNRESLGSFAEIEALVDAAASTGELLTLTIVNPLQLSNADLLGAVTPDMQDAEAAKDLMRELASLPLAPYMLAAYAATVDSTHEHGLVILLYPDQTSAGQALSSIPARLESLPTVRADATYAETWLGEPSVTTEAVGDLWLVTVRMSMPLSDIVDADGRISTQAGRPYHRLQRQFISRDTRWLLPN